MITKPSDWYVQANEYAISACNVSHEINNSLAILMGYTENLEYMLESGKIEAHDLQEICDKFFYAIEKLGGQARQIAADRKKDFSKAYSYDLQEYFHRWLKLQAPQFRKHGLLVNLQSGNECLLTQNWYEWSQSWAQVFYHLLIDVQANDLVKMELQAEFKNDMFVICLDRQWDWNLTAIDALNEPNFSYSVDEAKLYLQFSCQGRTETADSVA